MKKNRVVVKVGSNVVMHANFLAHFCRQMSILKNESAEIIIVTSGAVAHDEDKGRSKNLRAAIGQGRLIMRYIGYFDGLRLAVAQVLVTKHDLENPETLLPTLEEAMSDPGVIPIINANDTVNSEELLALGKYVDNDVLFDGIVRLTEATHGLIGIDQPGLKNDCNEVVANVSLCQRESALAWSRGGSSLGHGNRGMSTKLEVLFGLCAHGVKCALVPALSPAGFIDVLARLNGRSSNSLGTVFLQQ